MKTLITLFSVVLFAVSPGVAQPEGDIDEIFKDWNDISQPGGSIGIVHNGEQVLAKGYGSADLEHDIANSPSTVFYIGSVSKQFVTFCILLLEEQGKLNLDDDIHKYFPDFPDYGAPLTIRNFIHHTSGVRDYLTLMALKGRSYLDHITIEEVYNLIKAQKALNFTPGDRYLYSNSCYFMLALIVEKASGQSIREFARQEIFEPLGMNNSLFYDNNRDLIKNKAFSYQKTKDGWDNLISRFDLVGSGGVYSTIEDMYLWDQNFYNNKLGKGGQTIIERMHQEGILNNGDTLDYAFAIVNSTYRGLRTVGHTGSLAGYRSVQLRFPDQEFTVTILANRNDASASAKARQVADLYLAEFLKEGKQASEVATKAPKTIKLSEKKLSVFNGHYWNERVGFKAEVNALDGVLIYSEGFRTYTFAPVNKTEFIVKEKPSTKATFKEMGDGNYQLILSDGGTYVMEPFEPVNYSSKDLESFVGSWYSEELDFTYNIRKQGEGLTLFLGSVQDDALEVMKQNTLKAGNLILNFNDDITSFRIKAGRVQDVRFRKM